ncbi:hypothetical protein [Thalassoroseus pseudoceratinae]|uniref:hypothetical protein n=1 Tax=Thalassoroseus pseudoceratinae TaxID=2713176 RepID=UPI001420E6A8|nr:hypothetical protein [Thalassoroseus pseudoceratinae]
MPTPRTCLRLTLGILLAFAGLAVAAHADETPTAEFAGPAVAEKAIRPIEDVQLTKPEIAKPEIENVLTAETSTETIVTELEIILPTETDVEVIVPVGPAIAEKPVRLETIDEPTIVEVVEAPVVVEDTEAVEETTVIEVVVEEDVVVEIVEEVVIPGPAIAQKPVRIVAEPGPAIAEKPVRLELVEEVEIVVSTPAIPTGPAVAEAGPQRHAAIATVTKVEQKPQHVMETNDWVSLIAPQISPPAWIVCQWLFAR